MVNNIMNLNKDISMISKIGNVIKFLSILETTLTVGIIAFTVFRVINVFRTNE